MKYIANSIAVGGNLAKFFAPPSCCNPCSLNAPEWFAFLTRSITMIKAQTRDCAVEEVMCNREHIDSGWDKLIK